MINSFFNILFSSFLSFFYRDQIARLCGFLENFGKPFTYENQAKKILDQLNSNETPIYIDVGARRGVNSRHWSYRDYLEFHLFEPDRTESEFLSQFYDFVHSCGLSDETYFSELNILEGVGGSYTSHNMYAENLYGDEFSKKIGITGKKNQVVKKEKINIKKLSEFSFSKNIIYLKIDVQGEESNILKGIEGTFRPVMICVEASSILNKVGNSSIKEILQWAESQNYYLLGAKFQDTHLSDKFGEFDYAIQGDYFFIDKNFEKDVEIAKLACSMLLILSMPLLASKIYAYTDNCLKLNTFEKFLQPQYSSYLKKHKFNNAHDLRAKGIDKK